MTFLAAEAPDLIDRHTGDTDTLQFLLYRIKRERFDDRFDLFHFVRSMSQVLLFCARGARQMSQPTAIAIPTRAGIGGAPTTRTAVNAAITPAPIVSMM